MPPRDRQIVRRLAMVCAGVAVALLGLEVLVRVFDMPPRPLALAPFRTYRLSSNPILGYEYVPGYRPDQTPFDEHHAGFAINSAGFRDDEHTLVKPPGTVRVAFLGDSTTAGNGVRDRDDVYVERLERALAASPGAHFELLNLAVGGYQTVQEVETLRTRGIRYDPDFVVLLFCQNDFEPRTDGGVYGILRHVNAGHAPRARALAFVLRHSRLAFVLYHAYFADEMSREHDRWYRAHVLRGRDPVTAGIAALRRLQAERPIPAVVVILPVFTQRFSHYPARAMHDRVQAIVGESSELRVLDPLPAFAQVDDRPERFSDDGLHLNAEGHRVLADFLLPYLRSLRPAP